MAVRVLLVVAAFAILYGCGKASSPPEEVQKGEGIELLSKQSKPMRPGISAQVQLSGKVDTSFAVDAYDIDGFDNGAAVVDRYMPGAQRPSAT